MEAHFSPELFTFLRQLTANNERTWFLANKQRYEAVVVAASLNFISAFDRRLESISRQFQAVPKRAGGSLFGMRRDARLAKDKGPYKARVGIHFRHHEAKNVHAPGFYLHLEPGRVFMGGGIWRPDRFTLATIRARIAEAPEAWFEVVDDAAFTEHFVLGGDSLKRAPRGFDFGHPAIEDLKRKDFIAISAIHEEAVFETDFVDRFAELCRTASPFVRALCSALNMPF